MYLTGEKRLSSGVREGKRIHMGDIERSAPMVDDLEALRTRQEEARAREKAAEEEKEKAKRKAEKKKKRKKTKKKKVRSSTEDAEGKREKEKSPRRTGSRAAAQKSLRAESQGAEKNCRTSQEKDEKVQREEQRFKQQRRKLSEHRELARPPRHPRGRESDQADCTDRSWSAVFVSHQAHEGFHDGRSMGRRCQGRPSYSPSIRSYSPLPEVVRGCSEGSAESRRIQAWSFREGSQTGATWWLKLGGSWSPRELCPSECDGATHGI